MRSIIDEIRYILQKNFTFIILFTFAVFYPIVSTSRVGRYDGSYEKIKMLNDEGVRLSNNEQFSQAVEHLFGAHKLDPENKTIKKNLANTYVRFAIELKSAGKQDEAIALLEKASLLNANIDSLHTLLARLYYEKGDLLNAEKETRIALLGSPHDPHLLKFLAHLSFLMEKHSDALDAYHRISEIHHIPIDTFDTGKINREREVFASYQKMYAHPFIVYYPNNQYKERAGWVAQSLSQAYLRLGEWFKYYPATEISVYCYTQEDFGSVTHDNVYIIGLYDGKIRIRIDSDSEIQLKKTAAHEYAHHVLSCITRHNIPF
ncbi:hypothetical protein KDK77_03680, partial [bacterium]|nr:hypothetical protein [bacterium]